MLVVGTSGLPRDALVEVEVAAFANNTIPAEAFQYREAAGSAELCGQVIDMVKKAEDSMAAQIDAWPIWSAPSLSQGAVLGGPVRLGEETSVNYTAESQFSSLSRNLCIGFVSVRACREHRRHSDFGTELMDLAALNGAVVKTTQGVTDLFVDIDEAVELLVQEVSAMLHKSKVLSVFLRTLRVYYVVGAVSTEDLSAALAAQLCATLGVTKFPLLLVPMQCLDIPSNSSRRTVLAAQVSAFDLAQIDTEEWIHVKE